MKCPQCDAENLEDSRYCRQCATPLPTPLPGTPPPDSPTLIAAFEKLTRGTVFAGRYEIIEELGKGGMGTVYKAFDQKLQEVVALKIIRPELSFNTAAVERFKSELKNARRIAHRYVCRLYDLGDAGLVQFISMEYVEGEDLKKFIRRAGPIGAGRAVAIARQVSEGLAEAHRMGVIHRDLKPQNIMIDRDGRARIMDFGLSRFLASEGMTGTGVMLGTPEYMSPEQVELREVDARSDLYAMGVILFEMVTGRVPFEGQTPLAVAIKHKNDAPPDARDTNPLVPEPLVRIIYRCLEKDPAKRYQSAEALAADLAALETDLPTIVREISRGDLRTPAKGQAPPRKPRASHRSLIIAAGAVIMMVVLAGILARKGVHGKFGAGMKPESQSGQMVPPPPENPRDREPSGTERSRRFEFSLPGLAGIQLKDALEKVLKSADTTDLENTEKVIESVKGLIPDKGPYRDAYDKLVEQVQARKQAANPAAAAKPPNRPPGENPKEIQGDMQKLLSLVSEREGARTAKTASQAAKTQAQKAGADDRNLLFRLARYEEGNAEDAFSKNDFSGARALYRVLERTYALSPGCPPGTDCTPLLRQILGAFKAETAGLAPADVDPWLLEYARAAEGQAQEFLNRREVDNAGGAYLRAAFLYEKIKEAASAPTPKS